VALDLHRRDVRLRLALASGDRRFPDRHPVDPATHAGGVETARDRPGDRARANQRAVLARRTTTTNLAAAALVATAMTH
jgi:hypothetical protein